MLSMRKYKADDFASYIGGPATNAAVYHAHLGGTPFLITSFGDNKFTHDFQSDMRSCQVDYLDLSKNVKCEAVMASIITSLRDGERMIFSYMPNMEERQLSLPNDIHYAAYKTILVDGFYMPYAIEVARNGKSAGVPVVLDGGSWKEGMDGLLPHIDYAICSADFFPPGCSDHDQVAAYLKAAGAKVVVITRGADDLLVFKARTKMKVPVPKVKTVDTVAAGDFFHGAFCYYLPKVPNLEKCLKKAAAFAAASCQNIGPRWWL